MHLRAPFLAILALVTIVGLVLTAFNHNSNVRYLGKLHVSSLTIPFSS
jgi:hypothetical protein